jgi:hypothetical protein
VNNEQGTRNVEVDWRRNKEWWSWFEEWIMNKEQGMMKLIEEGTRNDEVDWIVNNEHGTRNVEVDWRRNKEWWSWMNKELGMMKLIE